MLNCYKLQVTSTRYFDEDQYLLLLIFSRLALTWRPVLSIRAYWLFVYYLATYIILYIMCYKILLLLEVQVSDKPLP